LNSFLSVTCSYTAACQRIQVTETILQCITWTGVVVETTTGQSFAVNKALRNRPFALFSIMPHSSELNRPSTAPHAAQALGLFLPSFSILDKSPSLIQVYVNTWLSHLKYSNRMSLSSSPSHAPPPSTRHRRRAALLNCPEKCCFQLRTTSPRSSILP